MVWLTDISYHRDILTHINSQVFCFCISISYIVAMGYLAMETSSLYQLSFVYEWCKMIATFSLQTGNVHLRHCQTNMYSSLPDSKYLRHGLWRARGANGSTANWKRWWLGFLHYRFDSVVIWSWGKWIVFFNEPGGHHTANTSRINTSFSHNHDLSITLCGSWVIPLWACNNSWHTCQVYPGCFREPHWLSMGLPEISRVTRPLCHDVGQPHYRYYMMLPQSAPLSPDGLKLQHQSSSPCHHKQLPTNTQLKLQHLSRWTMPCGGQLSTLTPSLFQVPNWLRLCSMKDPLDVVRVGAWNSLTHTRLPHQNCWITATSPQLLCWGRKV